MKKTIKNKNNGRRKTMHKRRNTRKMGGYASIFKSKPLQKPIYLEFSEPHFEKLLDMKHYLESGFYEKNKKKSFNFIGVTSKYKNINEHLQIVKKAMNQYDPQDVESYYKKKEQEEEEGEEEQEQEEEK